MNGLVMGCVGLWALAGGSAAAADLPQYYQPGPAYNPIYTWTGFYVGINGGGGWGRSQWDAVDTFDLSGGLIGGTIGHNLQVPGAGIGAGGGHDPARPQGATAGGGPARCRARKQLLAPPPRALGL